MKNSLYSTQSACAVIYLLPWLVPLCRMFCRFFINSRHKEWNRTENVFLDFFTNFPWITSHFKKNRQDILINIQKNLRVKLTWYFIRTWIFPTYCIETININLQGNFWSEIQFGRCRNSYMNQINTLRNYMNSSERLIGFPSVISKILLEINNMYF